MIIAVVVVVLIIGVGGVAAALLIGRSTTKVASSSATAPRGPVTSVSSVPASPTTAPATTGGGGSAVERPEAPAGYKVVADDTKGYAFITPISWQTSDLTKEKLDQLIESAKDSNPQLASTLEGFQAAVGLGGLAFGYDVGASPNDPVPSLDLLSFPSGGLTPDQVAAQLDLQVGAVNATIVSKVKVKVAGKDAVLVGVKIGVGLATPVQHQLYLASEGKMYVFTVGNADDATASNILRSLRVP